MQKEKSPSGENVEPGKSELSEEEIDETLDESFPGSDPPSWTLGTNHRTESLERETKN